MGPATLLCTSSASSTLQFDTFCHQARRSTLPEVCMLTAGAYVQRCLTAVGVFCP